MACFSIPDVKLLGLAVAVPKEIEKNTDYQLLSEKDRELLIKTTGIGQRRVAPPGLKTSDLCLRAAQELLLKLDWKAEDIDILIFVSQSADYILPSTAPILQHKLGMKTGTMAFDIGLGCSGYVYGLSVISALLSRMPGKKALLLCGDVSTFYTDHSERGVYPIFSDAGSASALSFEAGECMHFNAGTDGSGSEAIRLPNSGMHKSAETNKGLQMNGIDVFQFSLAAVPGNIQELLQYAALDANKVDYFVLHQANKLINDSIRKRLDIDASKFPSSLEEFGNTSSATIPLTMLSKLSTELGSKDLQLCLSGFGVGFSWCSALIHCSNVCAVPLIEY
jgi:3-oxoacyl-[acyl-carrier-protein] synthase-3